MQEPIIRCRGFLAHLVFYVAIGCVSEGCSIQSVYVSQELSGSSVARISDEDIAQTLFLIGDAGEPSLESKEPALAVLEREASVHPERNMIIFLGDNLYPQGMPEASNPQRRTMEKRLDEQIKVGERSNASVIFIPGNHDWGSWSGDGVESIRERRRKRER